MGLHRPELRAWAAYDFGISSFQTTIQVAFFQLYFVGVAAVTLPNDEERLQLWAIVNTIAAVLVAVLSPILGAMSDVAAAKKRILAAGMLLGVAAVGGMFFIDRGEYLLASWLYVLATVGATASLVMYEALLPHIASTDEMDRVSSAGYAFGYIGGGLLLAINVVMFLSPATFGFPTGADPLSRDGTLAIRASFVTVAIWWLLFSIPLFRRVREPARTVEADEVSASRLLITPFVRLRETLQSLRAFKQAFLMLLAFLVYNDGIQTIIKMATGYGEAIGIERSALITAILIVQFVGFPFAFLFGMLAGRIGTKRAIFLGLLIYIAITIVGFNMDSARDFYMLAFMVGMVQGGTQALSRSLFASMIPAHKSGEFFGFYSVFEKFSSIGGPLLFAAAIELTGSSRYAILGVIVFFVVGAWILSRVNVAEGQRLAKEAEQGVVAAARI
jgi:UMF1 family MFS transporter